MGPPTSPAPQSFVQQPQAAIAVNGTKLGGCLVSVLVTNNNYYAADSFEATLAVSGLPQGFGPQFWSSAGQITVELLVGLPPLPAPTSGVGPSSILAPPASIAPAPLPTNQMTSLIMGLVDNAVWQPEQGLIAITGRDFTAGLIEARTTEKFANLTSSQIAALLAARHNLQTQITATSKPAGHYYELEHARLTNETSEWNLLAYLAREEGFDVFVKRQTLYFQPHTSAGATPYPISYVLPPQVGYAAGNFKGLKLQRSLTLANDVIVYVQSWNAKRSQGFTVKYKSVHTRKTETFGGIAQTYYFVEPGLTKDQALQKAQSYATDITLHERVIEVDMPGETTIDARTLLELTGTQSDWDQTYYVDRIERRLSFEGGFQQHIRAKNRSPVSEVAL